jgi:3',5'-cyclic AMP phosphodiesterase CpdA
MKKYAPLLFIPLIFAIWAFVSPAASVFRVKPYLQVYQNGKFQITWYTTVNQSAVLEFYDDQGNQLSSQTIQPEEIPILAYTNKDLNQNISGLTQGSWLYSNIAFRYRTQFEELKPGQVYYYIVKINGETYSNGFKASPDSKDWDKIRFIALADSETEPFARVSNRAWYPRDLSYRPSASSSAWKDKFGVTVDNGIPVLNYALTESEGYKNNLKIINSRDPDFIVMPGDLVQGSGYQPGWDEFWRHNAGEYNDGLGHYPIIPALGNWENYGANNGGYGYNENGVFNPKLSRERFHEYFETPNNDPLQKHRQSYYRVDYGPVTILTLDSSNGTPDQNRSDFPDDQKIKNQELTIIGTDTQENYTQTQYESAGGTDLSSFGPGSAQYEWLQANLESAKEAGQMIFVQFHHIAFSSGEHGVPINHELSTGQDGVAMRVLHPLFEDFGVIAVLSGHDELFERSFVDVDNDGKGVLYYDVGVAGDGMRGEKRNWIRNPIELLNYNPYKKWTADQDEPEQWDTSGAAPMLIDGGKHYGHLEVNIEKTVEDGDIYANIQFTPVYSFPVLDSNYDLVRVERRVYGDEVSLKILLSQDDFVPEVISPVKKYLDAEGKAMITSEDVLVEQPDSEFVFVYSTGADLDCSDLGEQELIVTSVRVSDSKVFEDTVQLVVMDTIAPKFTASDANLIFDPVVGKLEYDQSDFGIEILSDNCPNGSEFKVDGPTITCQYLNENENWVDGIPVTITLTDQSGNSTSVEVEIYVELEESQKISLQANKPLYSGGTVELSLGEELDYEVISWYRNGSIMDGIKGKTIVVNQAGNYFATLRLASGCIVESNKLEISVTDVPFAPVKDLIELNLDENGEASLEISDLFTSWPPSQNLEITTSDLNFDCESLGEHTIEIRIESQSGQIWDETTTVFVKDNSKPVIVSKNVSLNFDPSKGAIDLAPEMFVESVTDNCGIKSLTISKQEVGCGDFASETLIEIRAEDNSGNVTESTATLNLTWVDSKPVFIEGVTELCEGNSTELTLSSEAEFEVVRWRRNGVEIAGQSGKNITIEEGGEYHAVIRYSGGCLAETGVFEVQLIDIPQGEITVDGNILIAPEGMYTYQWFKGDQAISGAANQTLVVNQMGSFSVSITNEFGCITHLKAVEMTISGLPGGKQIEAEALVIYPNPSKTEVVFEPKGDLEFVENSWKVYDLNGKDVGQSVFMIHQSSKQIRLDVSTLASGTYSVMVESQDNRIFLGRFIKLD